MPQLSSSECYLDDLFPINMANDSKSVVLPECNQEFLDIQCLFKFDISKNGILIVLVFRNSSPFGQCLFLYTLNFALNSLRWYRIP